MVHTWWLNIDAGRTAGDLTLLLDARENRRAATFRHSRDRIRYQQGHIGLRLLLSAYLGTSASGITFVRLPCPLCGAAHGRPALGDNRAIHFSMSYSESLVAYAVSTTAVGIDIEASHLQGALDLVAQFHPAEISAIGSLPIAEQPAAALQCWVRKEAYLKGTGAGIVGGLAAEFLGLGTDSERTTQPRAVPAGWSVINLRPPSGYYAATALFTGSSPIVPDNPQAFSLP